jgi:alpha-beta hydrolase superfamily lysophospholipase
MRAIKNYFIVFLLGIPVMSQAQETITFKAEDGIEITAELYMTHPTTAPFIVLFHQANWSRGEYQEIAPKLNALGYNCMAIDQRSGGAVNGIRNKTKINAEKAMKGTQYIDALADMNAAIIHARTNFAEDKLIIWGSSYSSALVLKIAGDQPDAIDGALAFSPGEYFARFDKPADFITSSAKHITKPVFITSGRDEKGSWWKIYEAIGSDGKSYFLPETSGNHGSRALWVKFNDSKDYWKAVTEFLETI